MTSLPKPLSKKFSLTKLLDEARQCQSGDTKLSSPILARCRRSSVKTNPLETSLSATPLSCKTDVKLYCKNQLCLRISEDGVVGGTRDYACPYSMLQLHSISKSTVRIYSPRVHQYLAIDSSGRLCSKDRPTEETVFQHVHEMNGFHTFASHKYYKESLHDMFVALKKDGHPKKATTTFRLHKASQFLLI